MNWLLVAAAFICFSLAVWHTVVGNLWVFPRLQARALPSTPVGGPYITEAFMKVTWHFVGITLVSFGAFLLLMAGPQLPSGTLVAVRGIGGVFAAVSLMVIWRVRRKPTTLLRAPIWMLFVAVAVLCWEGAGS